VPAAIATLIMSWFLNKQKDGVVKRASGYGYYLSVPRISSIAATRFGAVAVFYSGRLLRVSKYVTLISDLPSQL